MRDVCRRAAARVKALLERMENDVRVRAVAFFAALVLIAGIQFLLNLHTPLMMDDYDYSFSWHTGERIAGLMDVLASQAAHYRLWGGRSVVHALAQGFLSVDKMAFNVANTAMYVLLLLELYALARPKGRAFCWPVLLLAHSVLFLLVPFFGTVFLWLTGACNYLWGTALALLPLLMFRSVQEGGVFSRKTWAWWMVPASFLAGWTNENTACGVLFLMFVLLAATQFGGRKPMVQQWVALAAEAAGVAVMLLAPGNFSRASSYASGSMILELIRRAVMATAYGVVYIGPILLIALAVYAVSSAVQAKARTGSALLLLLGGAAAAYAMVASPVFSDRSWTGVMALALCAAMLLLGDLDAHVRVFDAAKMAALPLILALVAYGGYQALDEVKAHEAAWLAQTKRMETAAAQGEESVTIQSVLSGSRFTMDVKLAQNASDWPNSTLSKAFGVNVNGP